MDIREAIEEYLGSITRLETGTRYGYEQRLGVFSDWCTAQGICLEQVRAKVVDTFVLHLKATHTSHSGDPLSSYTLQGYIRCILAFLHWCVEDEQFSEFVKPLVVKRIKLPKLTQKIIQVYTSEHIDALLRAASHEYNLYLQERAITIIKVLLATGIRAQELCTLKIGDCHLKPNTLKKPSESYIKVMGKGRKEREVGLDEDERRVLAHFIRIYRAKAKPSDVVFVGRTESAPMSVDGLEGMFNRLAAWSGIDESQVRVSPHTFRHTFSARFILAGGSIYHLSRILGHSAVTTTEKYLASISGTQIRLSLVKQS
jgi:site-specific recombinase XerD